LADDGMPRKGILGLTYYSGAGQGKMNCAPKVEFRKSLLELVLQSIHKTGS